MFDPIASTSLQYVAVDVRAKEAGNVVNPTADTVTMAFVTPGTLPVSGDFKTASWETNANTNPDTYTVLCLVGPGGGTITLTADTDYAVWLKIVDSPETPILRVPGLLSVL